MRPRIARRVGALGEWTPRSKLSEKHCPRVALLSIDSGRATRAPFTHSIITPREGEAHVSVEPHARRERSCEGRVLMTSAQMSEVSRDASGVPIAMGRRDVRGSCRVALARARVRTKSIGGVRARRMQRRRVRSPWRARLAFVAYAGS